MNGDGRVDHNALLSNSTSGSGSKTPPVGSQKRGVESVDGVQGDEETCGQKRLQDSASGSVRIRKSRVSEILDNEDSGRAADGSVLRKRWERMLETDAEEQKQVCDFVYLFFAFAFCCCCCCVCTVPGGVFFVLPLQKVARV